jgi:hypothetical protein
MKDFISEIIRRVRDEKLNLADTVTAGTNVNSFEDYQYLIGKIDGLRLTLDVIDQILTEDEEENDL